MNPSEFLSRATKRIAKQSEVKEIDIEDHYVKHAKNKKCKALKLIFLNKKGFPDRTTLCRGGGILFIEFKRKGKQKSSSTSNQIKVRALLESFGFEYHVCDEIGQAEKYLDNFLEDMLL